MKIHPKERETVFVPVEFVGPDTVIHGRLNGQGHLRYIRVGAVLHGVPGVGLCIELELIQVQGMVATIRFGNGETADVLEWHSPDKGLRLAG